MRKNTKRLFSLILSLVIVAGFATGCKKTEEDGWLSEVVYEDDSNTTSGGNQSDNSTTSGNQSGNAGSGNSSGNNNQSDNGNSGNANTNITNPLKADLKGKTIKVYAVRDFTDVNSKNSKAEAAQAEMVTKLQKELNCKIVVTKYNADALYQQVMLNIASGTYFADIVMPSIGTQVGYISSKYAYNLAKISTVDLSKDYMNVAGGVKAFKFGSGNWAVAEPLSNSGFGNALFFNKRILKEITGNDNYIYDLMNKKQWNISNFRALTKKAVKDLDGVSGITEKDQLGIIQIDIGTSAYSNVFEALGVDMVKNNNGVVSYNMKDSGVVTAANLAYDIYIKDGTCTNMSDGPARDAFKSGHGLFLGGAYMGMLASISEMDDEFGLAPYPTKDGGSTYSLPANWNFDTIFIPSNLKGDQVKNAGAFLQAYCYLANDVIKTKYNEYQSRYLCDDQSRTNLDVCYKAVRITPSAVIGNSSLTDIFNGTYMVCYKHASGENISTLIQSTAKAAETGVKELNEKFK